MDVPSGGLNAINRDWLVDVQKTGGKVPKGFVLLRSEDVAPSALEASTRAMTEL